MSAHHISERLLTEVNERRLLSARVTEVSDAATSVGSWLNGLGLTSITSVATPIAHKLRGIGEPIAERVDEAMGCAVDEIRACGDGVLSVSGAISAANHRIGASVTDVSGRARKLCAKTVERVLPEGEGVNPDGEEGSCIGHDWNSISDTVKSRAISRVCFAVDQARTFSRTTLPVDVFYAIEQAVEKVSNSKHHVTFALSETMRTGKQGVQYIFASNPVELSSELASLTLQTLGIVPSDTEYESTKEAVVALVYAYVNVIKQEKPRE